LIFLYRRAAATSDGVTQEGRPSRPLVVPVQARREVPEANPGGHIPRGDGEGNIQVPNWPIPHCREKPLARQPAPVPQTDTGRRGENPKARGRTLVKELGKLTP